VPLVLSLNGWRDDQPEFRKWLIEQTVDRYKLGVDAANAEHVSRLYSSPTSAPSASCLALRIHACSLFLEYVLVYAGFFVRSFRVAANMSSPWRSPRPPRFHRRRDTSSGEYLATGVRWRSIGTRESDTTRLAGRHAGAHPCQLIPKSGTKLIRIPLPAVFNQCPLFGNSLAESQHGVA
jgi:hypothetical protein